MNTEIIKITDDFEPLKTASKIVKNGGLVAMPTETVYGLGADALNSEACKRIYVAKGRPSDNPLIIHICNFESLEKYTDIKDPEIKKLAFALARAFMPGPLTMILEKAKIIPDEVTAGLNTVAVRFPSNKIAQKLIEFSGVPIAAPSANISGSPSPTSAQHVINDLFGKIDMIIDGGNCELGLESTIIMPQKNSIKLLRPGSITVEQLSPFTSVTLDKAITEKLDTDEKPLAPGMKYRHYAPHVPVTIIRGDHEKVIDFFEEKLKSNNAILCFEEQKAILETPKNAFKIFSLGHIDNQSEQAHELFERLREVDDFNFENVYASEPKKSGVGLAVYNRLLKACGFNTINV